MPTPTSPDTVGPVASNQLQLGAHRLDYLLCRSPRRSIGFMINDDGLRVSAPSRLAQADIEAAIRAKQGWILSKLQQRQERRALRLQHPALLWIDGAQLPYLGDSITLCLHQGPRHRASFDQATRQLHLWRTPDSTELQLKECVRTWLQHDARRLFGERLALYAASLGVDFHSFALSSAATRWGSCSAQRKIRLNWRLIHFALPLVDYVIAHELSHLREMNHGPRFWATVGSIYPDHKGARLALRKDAQALPALF
jgi:predicted metal-dependent hydrolase